MKKLSFLFLLSLLVMFSFTTYVPFVQASPDSITYNPSTNRITVTGYTEASPCEFNDLWVADKSGTLQLLANTMAGNHTLTRQVRPADNKSIQIDIIASQVTASGWCNITGTEKDDSVQTENITVNANQTYTTTKYWKTVSYINCTGTWYIKVQQGQWGVFWKLDSRSFRLDCWLYVGNMDTWEDGNLASEGEMLFISGSFGIHVYSGTWGFPGSTIRFGKLIDANLKICEKGVTVIADYGTGTPQPIIYSEMYCSVELYSSIFMVVSAGHQSSLKFYEDFKVYSCILDGVWISIGSGNVAPDVYRLTVQKMTDDAFAGIWVGTSLGIWTDILAHSCYHGIGGFFTFEATVRNPVLRNNTYAVGLLGTAFEANLYLINPDADVWSINWKYPTSTGKVWRQYEFDLTVTYANGTAIQNANVTLSHYGENAGQDFTELTDANGQISTKTLTMGFYNATGGDTIYDYNPYNLTITKDGYQTYTKNFTLTEETDWTIALNKPAGKSAGWFLAGLGILVVVGIVIGGIYIVATKKW